MSVRREGGRSARGRRLAALLIVLVAPPARAQGTAAPAVTISGRVLRGTAGVARPVAGQRVVLHRIDGDSAGPVDSTRSSASGAYRLRARHGGDSAVYIVSARYAGVAYFTAPLAARDLPADSANITVYDTTARAFPLAVRGRHLVVAKPSADGTRRVVDVFELANDSLVTRVAGASPDGTWRIRLPAGVQSPAVGQGDISPDAVRFDGETATVFAPVPPGLRQIVLTYELPARRDRLRVPVDQRTGVLEVLLEDPSGNATGGNLARQPPVSMQGRSFERFIGEDVPGEAVLQLSLPGDAGGVAGALASPAGRALLVALAGALLALGIVVGRRRGGVPARAAAPAAPAAVDALVNALAALDAVFERQAAPSPAARQAYERRRAELKARLVSLLAASDDAR